MSFRKTGYGVAGEKRSERIARRMEYLERCARSLEVFADRCQVRGDREGARSVALAEADAIWWVLALLRRAIHNATKPKP